MSDYLSMTVIILLALIGGIVIGYQYRSYRCEHALRRRDSKHFQERKEWYWRGVDGGIESQRRTQRAATHGETIIADSSCLSAQKVTDSAQ